MTNDPNQPNQVPLPSALAKKPKPIAPREGAFVPTPTPTVGSFFAQHRATIDARRMHLDRVGMLPEHANALRMPDLAEQPVAPAVHTESLPDVNVASDDYQQPRLPKLAGVEMQEEAEQE